MKGWIDRLVCYLSLLLWVGSRECGGGSLAELSGVDYESLGCALSVSNLCVWMGWAGMVACFFK